VAFVALFPRLTSRYARKEQKKAKILSFVMFWIYYGLALTATIGVFVWNYFLDPRSTAYTTMSYILAVTSSALTCFIWLPQIWSTWAKQDPGALSLVMIGILIPGSFLTIYNLIGFGYPVLIWGPTCITGAAQLTLGGMCIYFKFFKKGRPVSVELALADPADILPGGVLEVQELQPLSSDTSTPLLPILGDFGSESEDVSQIEIQGRKIAVVNLAKELTATIIGSLQETPKLLDHKRHSGDLDLSLDDDHDDL